MKTENFCLYSIYIVVLMCLTDFLQTYLTTLHPLPSEWGFGWENNHMQSCRRKQCNMYMLLCTIMPLPGNEPINITFVQAMGKYKCLYYTASPQYSNSFLHDRIIKIFCEKKVSIQVYTSILWCSNLFIYHKQTTGVPGMVAGNCALMCRSFSSGVIPNLSSYTVERENRGYWNKFAPCYSSKWQVDNCH